MNHVIVFCRNLLDFFCDKTIQITADTKVKTCRNLVMKDIPKNNPAKLYFLLIMKFMAKSENNVEAISVSIMPLKKKNVGENASKREAVIAMFLSSNLEPILYVK